MRAWSGWHQDPLALSAEGIEFSTRASEALGAANLASGADPEAAATAVAGSTTFYTTDPNAEA